MKSFLASVRPSNSGALGGLAWVRKRQERMEEAAALWRRAAEAGSTDFRVHYWNGPQRWDEIGPTYDPNDTEKRALLEAARAAFRKSAELNPDFAEAHAMYGRTYIYEPREAGVDDGITALETAHRALPAREDVSRDLARLYDKKGDASRAEAVRKASAVPKTKDTEPEWAGAAGFQARVEKINRLLEERKVDEAIAVLAGSSPNRAGKSGPRWKASGRSCSGRRRRTGRSRS